MPAPSNVSQSSSNISVATNIPRDIILPAPSVINANTVAKQTISVVLPPAWDYWDMRMLCQGLTLAMIAEIRVIVNGNVRMRWSGNAAGVAGVQQGGEVLDLENQYDGLPSYGAGNSGVLMIPFRRLKITGGAQSLGAAPAGSTIPAVLFSGSSKDLALLSTLNCGSVDQNGVGIGLLSLEIDLINTLSAPSMQLRATVGAPTAGGSGLVWYIQAQTVNVAAGAQYNFGNAAFKFGDSQHILLNRIYFIPPTGTMDNWTVRWNGTQILQRTSAENDLVQQSGGHTPQDANGLYAIDYVERGFGDEMLPVGAAGTDYQIDATPSAAGNIVIHEFALGNL